MRRPGSGLTLKAGEVKGRPWMVRALDQAPWGAASGATGPSARVMPNRSVGAMSMPTMMNTYTVLGRSVTDSLKPLPLEQPLSAHLRRRGSSGGGQVGERGGHGMMHAGLLCHAPILHANADQPGSAMQYGGQPQVLLTPRTATGP